MAARIGEREEIDKDPLVILVKILFLFVAKPSRKINSIWNDAVILKILLIFRFRFEHATPS